jgi:2,3-bisphosphoglycerate-dependent phosphoglycerate mutase
MIASESALILVRHGQSQWNRENRFTGWVDVPLTAQGMEEARRAGEMLRGRCFDRAFTSALRRAQDTLRIILEVIGQTDVPVECSPALNERHYGDLQGLNKDETAQRLGRELVYRWRRTYEARPPNGESLQDTAARVLPYFEAHIRPPLLAGQTVLVVAHANSLRALVMALDGIAPADVPDLHIRTGVPLVYGVDGQGRVAARGDQPP